MVHDVVGNRGEGFLVIFSRVASLDLGPHKKYTVNGLDGLFIVTFNGEYGFVGMSGQWIEDQSRKT
jgi:hypothetical protein